jgi:hypothetical protein
MSDGAAQFLAPNPYHQSAMPMMHLQGDIGEAHTQAPMDESTNYMNDRPQSDTHMIDWVPTIIGDGNKGGDTPNRGNDTNGRRTPPTQSSTSA